MPDSPRWCARCERYGDHHTDRCPKFAQAAPLACECEAGCHNTVAPGSRACWFCIKAGCPLTVVQVKETPWDEVPQRDCYTKGQGLSCGPEHLWATLLNTEYRCTGTRGPYEPGVGAPEAGAAATAPAIKQSKASTDE